MKRYTSDMDVKSLCILGRQPIISCAELESLYADKCEKVIGEQAMILNLPPEQVEFQRIGGTIKLCEIISVINTNSWQQIEKYLVDHTPLEIGLANTEGKIHLGISVYGLNIKPAQIMSCGLKLKKIIRKQSKYSVRLTANDTSVLSSAQVIHNKLTNINSREIVLIRDGSRTIYAKTIKVQNINNYSFRDYGRPKRDARVGMLSPKLAQIIINLATGQLEINPTAKDARKDKIILDPFCGTGVILQEALLIGYSTYGSDVSERMIDYATTNVSDWFNQYYPDVKGSLKIELGDARTYKWKKPFTFVASELFLGKPLVTLPPINDLKVIIEECNLLAVDFLKNIYSQLDSGSRLCLALPAWRSSGGQFYHLPILDQIEDMGYNRLRFKRASNEGLIYCRQQQIVGRELLILTRK